jgi:starvation-inducible outer membrane lipoprotein
MTMKKRTAYAIALAAVAAVAVTACSTINVNIGTSPATEQAGTNSVGRLESEFSSPSNGVARTVASGGIVVNINMNAAKDIKPATTATLAQ